MSDEIRTRISPEYIRKGDKIRVERDGEPHWAYEYEATVDGQGKTFAVDWPYEHTFYLLERLTPTIDLPGEPTLGFVDFGNIPAPVLSFWYVSGDWLVNSDGNKVNTFAVTSWVPATAVPTDALDRLEDVVNSHSSGSLVITEAHTFIRTINEMIYK